MMRLSDRLQRIADEIREGETMADIGTDHGFLPVFLAESGRCPRVIMTDVSPLSLDKARITAGQRGGSVGKPEKAQGDGGMDFRVGDGLSVLEPYEADAVVIAGMGGKLIRDIMAADMDLTRSIGKFILQPRNGQGYLRKWLMDNGFVIVREGIVHEGRHIPEIITALSPDGDRARDDLMKSAEEVAPDMVHEMRLSEAGDIRWRIPPWMIYADGPVCEFLLRSEAAEREKLDNVRRARKRDMELEKKILQDIEYLKRLRKEYGDGK